MRDFSGPGTPQTTLSNPVRADNITNSLASISRSLVIALAALIVVVVSSAEAAVVGANTLLAAAFGYICISLACWGCSLAFLPYARAAKGSLRARWLLMAGGTFAAGMGYALSFAEMHNFTTAAAKPFQIASFTASEAMYILAVVLFFAGSARSIVLVDMSQALLLALLRFKLTYSANGPGHFTSNHLLIGQLLALFLFLITLVACVGASSSSERKFLRMLSLFFGIRLVDFFLSNQDSYAWLHHELSSIWDVAGTLSLGSFAVFLLFANRPSRVGTADALPLQRPTLTVRNLMPSFLAIVNLMLGLFMLRISVPLAALAISLSVLSYVARTVLLQGQAAQEKAQLQSRNEHLEGLATCDPLTGIGNRRSLAAEYSRLQTSNGATSLAILLMDIDHFKQANDRHGHLHGDKVLISLANQLQKSASEITGSHCARFGGDEFAVLLPGLSLQTASEIAQEIRLSFFAQTHDAGEKRASLSMGVALLGAAHELSLEALISYADAALYRAKLLGRNRVEIQKLYDLAPSSESPAPQAEELPALR